MPCLVPPLLLLLAFLDEPSLTLLVGDDGGFGVAAHMGASRTTPAPIPLLARSERVQRAVPAARGIVLRLFGRNPFPIDQVRIRAVRHPADHQVLVDDRGPRLVGPPILPRSATAWREGMGVRSVLAELARQDLVAVEGRSVRIVPPSDLPQGAELVVLGREESPGAAAGLLRVIERDGRTETDDPDHPLLPLPGDPRQALILPTGGTETWLRVPASGGAGAVSVDQVFYARTSPIADLETRELEILQVGRSERLGAEDGWIEALRRVDGEAIDLGPSRFVEITLSAPPHPPQGSTWTLLVDVRPPRGERAPVVDSSAPRRPPPEPTPPAGWLVDVARAAGVATSHLEGPDEQLDIRPTMGPGAAFGDGDGDGRVDLYLVQGGGRAGSDPLRNRFLLNRSGGTFEDVTESAGCGDTGAGMGALFLDADGDGDLDLYVANYGADALFANVGRPADPRFENVSATAGVGGDLWSAGVAAADHDLDGDLDLYVASYLLYDEELMPPEDELGRFQREDPVAMLPYAFPGQRNTFLRNDSEGESIRFADVTEELGLLDPQGRGMQAVFWDFDRDLDPDLYVANDVSYNVLWRNQGDGSFEDVSFQTGMDDPRGGMGVAIGDVDGDGDEDLFLTNWQLEANALYLNNLVSHRSRKHRVASFRDATVGAGFGPFGIGFTSWACELFDADNDGDLDLFVANGYTSPDYESTGICVGQPNHFFWNDGEGRFRDGSAGAGPALGAELPSRSAVACDYDQDGDLDLIVTTNNGPVQLLENRLEAKGHWLVLRLRSRSRNTHGIGAEVTVEAGGRLLRRSLRAGTSYLGGNPPEIHVGLGAAEEIESLVVRWPSGRTSTHSIDGIDRYVTLEEPE